MNKLTESKTQNQVLLEKIIDLIPPKEQEELKQKVEKFTAQLNLTSNTKKSRKTKKKNDNFDITSETFCLNPEGNESQDDTNNQSKNNIAPPKKRDRKEKRINSDNISLMEEEDEGKRYFKKESVKDEEVTSSPSSEDKNKNEDIISGKLTGKKRKSPEEDESELIEEKKNVSKQKIKIKKNNDDENSNLYPNLITLKRYKENLAEKELLVQLVKKEGFMKVFNCLTIYPLNRKNQLEKAIDDIIMNIGLLRTSLILLKIKFQNETPKNENNNSNTNSSNAELEDEDIEIVIDGEDKNITKRKRIDTQTKKNRNIASKIGYLKSNSENDLCIHLHKDKNGKIYKYNKNYTRDGNNKVAYYCADRRCNGKANYDSETMKFEIFKDHDITHEEHNYIRNKDRADKYKEIIKEFEQRDCHEAQVFKTENGSHVAKWYD